MSDTIRANVLNFLQSNGFTFEARYVGETVRDNDWQCDEWRVSLMKGKTKFETPFYTGFGHRKQVQAMPTPPYRKGTLAYEQWAKSAFKPQAPHAADVMHSLLLDGEAINESFTDWADNYGYDSDSIKALRTYEQCCATGKELRKLFTHAELETLREMMQDY